MLKNIDRYLKNISKHLKSLKKKLKKLQKYQYGIDYLFNENNDIDAFQQARTLLNERRGNLSGEETKRIRKKLQKRSHL